MGTGMRKTLGLVGIVAAATYITISNRKKRSALALHNRIGMPVYAYLKKKNYIPF